MAKSIAIIMDRYLLISKPRNRLAYIFNCFPDTRYDNVSRLRVTQRIAISFFT